MARRPRNDEPGAFHHVWNRGIAKRTMFEFQRDTRRFLAELAWEVHEGKIRVHAYVLMSNHFHLLVESVEGRLAESMQRVQSIHSRCFNRPRDRVGSLVQSRYQSRRIESLSDRITLVCYVDRNPVEARLSRHGAFYPHGSAAHYARPDGPPWLERSWVESVVVRDTGLQAYDPAAYPRVFQRGMSSDRVAWMEQRIRAGHRGPDPLDDLLRRAPEGVRSWMRDRAQLADGTSAGVPIASPAAVLDVVRIAAEQQTVWTPMPRKPGRCGWLVLRVGLLRDLAAETYRAIGARLGLSSSGSLAVHMEHRELLASSGEYADRVGHLAHEAIQRHHGWLLRLLPENNGV